MFLVISRCRKSLVKSTPKPDLLMCLYDLDVPEIRMNTLLNLFQVNFRFFYCFIFYSIAGQKFKIKEIFMHI